MFTVLLFLVGALWGSFVVVGFIDVAVDLFYILHSLV